VKEQGPLIGGRAKGRHEQLSWDLVLNQRPGIGRLEIGRSPPSVARSGLVINPEPRRSKRISTRDRTLDLMGEIRRLQARVEQLEAAAGSERRAGFGEHTQIEDDPFGMWIEAHRDILEQYPNQHIAIHPEHGIVFHSADDEVFGRWLERPSEYDDDEVLVTHSSLYV